jgi:nucleoside-diphosphate-sugar epimerase
LPFTNKAERLRALGAEAFVLDALDARAVREAVVTAEPDAIVHQATALANVRVVGPRSSGLQRKR